jgi:alkylation response protein AidB-like acyl-CoA dehydrogenase
MSEYSAPLDEMMFALEHVADLGSLTALPGFEDVDPAFARDLLEQAGRFMAEVMSPLNPVGDREGARLENGGVRMPEGFREAYQSYVKAGWGAVAFDPEYGGGGLPYTVGVVLTEMLASANMSFGLCPALGEGAIEALAHHGSEALRRTYLPRLVSGEWSATMDLTEPQAGSDLGAIRTQAVPQPDGSYRISGTKIFITFGDHDLTENVVHLVLARTPGAPAGSRGISCFIVPKFLVRPDGGLAERNDLSVVSLEHKLGIHASPTCVMSYGERGGATGFLIGEENQGLRYMFTMMNRERIFVGTQGLGIAERAYQRALAYARERRQGRAIGLERPSGEMSPIIDHADVRRMLLTMKAQIDAMRGLLYATAAAVDVSARHPDGDQRALAEARVALLTPVAKAWLSDLSVEIASLGIQIHGGVGYVEETGAAQYLRDARIAPIYEGTNGIQSLDLVMRKVPMQEGAVVGRFLEELRAVDAELAGADLDDIRVGLAAGVDALTQATDWLLERIRTEPRDVAAAAAPYLRLFGCVAGAYYLARSAHIARRRLEAGEDRELFAGKIASARFYTGQLLPQAAALLPAIRAGASPLYDFEPGGA